MNPSYPSVKTNVRARQEGVTLVELMVSITVGLILVGGLAVYFAGQKKTYSYQDAVAGLQDSARTAFIHISRDLRLAGYYGCVPQGGQPVVVSGDANVKPPAGVYSNSVRDLVTLQGTTTSLAEGFELAVMGQDNADSDAFDDASNKSDRLVINIATPLGLEVEQMNNSLSPIVVKEPDGAVTAAATLVNAGVVQGSVVAVADCEEAAVFEVSNDLTAGDGKTLAHNKLSDASINIDMQHIYGSDKAGPAELLKLRRVRYYIRKVEGRYSLYRCVGLPMTGGEDANYCTGDSTKIYTEELVSDVDAMQLQFGIADSCNSDGSANYSYVDPLSFDPERNLDAAERHSALLQTARAIAVRISLTFNAPGLANDDYAVDADGNRGGAYRQPYSTVVELRNGCKV